MLLVAPLSTTAPWYPLLRTWLVQQPIALPQWEPAVEAATLGALAPEPTESQVAPLVRANTMLVKAGYSQKVLDHMSAARGKSTRLVYQNKWDMFARYCAEQKWNPYVCKSADVAEFLSWPF